jgi:RHS repeat-associated protein
MRLMYWYHPDYLGHVEYITDLDGAPHQYFYYTAPMSRLPTSKPLAQRCFSADWSRPLARWGETLIEEKATRPGMHFESPYRFNAKELDEEPTNGSSRTPLKIKDNSEQTGLYYYGARYYNPMVSVWLGVDPKAYAFPHVTSYNFLLNNPIMMVDPGGDSTFSLRPNGGIVGLDGNRHFQQKNGQIKTVPEGMSYVQHVDEAEVDLLFKENNPNVSIPVTKGVLSGSRGTGRRVSITTPTGWKVKENISTQLFFFDNFEMAKEFFEFVTTDETVEWKHNSYNGSLSQVVGASFKSDKVDVDWAVSKLFPTYDGPSFSFNYRLVREAHNHLNQMSGPSEYDEKLKRKNGNPASYIYIPKSRIGYHPY